MKNVRRSKTANKHHKKRDEIRRLLFTNEYFEIETMHDVLYEGLFTMLILRF